MNPIAGKSGVKEDLKSVPLPELLAKLGSSSDGLSLGEAQRRLAQCGGASDDFHHPQPRPVLVHSSRGDSSGGSERHANDCHRVCGLWDPDDADRVGLGAGGVEVRPRLVPGERPD